MRGACIRCVQWSWASGDSVGREWYYRTLLDLRALSTVQVDHALGEAIMVYRITAGHFKCDFVVHFEAVDKNWTDMTSRGLSDMHSWASYETLKAAAISDKVSRFQQCVVCDITAAFPAHCRHDQACVIWMKWWQSHVMKMVRSCRPIESRYQPLKQ